ncbi:helix-turn-helix domain-containing protein [Streptomyces sp. AC512_CC834]|uniref:helix-turn-helix domain-containing protein n=1 Tax=Streptomyces sp. AC512_CC834 TaxID=2823691 RepID=UPI001C25B274|nr:helix-turn-helix domain-containing protein [Streptomyces sp. AC512_CC834]
MATANPSVPARAESAADDNRPRSGVIHDNVRHTANFTVVGNHLAQHPKLSLLAIGLGLYVQSVRGGTSVDIKSLTARFKEGAVRISAALRELEAHGYLRRERKQAPDGRFVTRTVSCNDPRTRHRAATGTECPARPTGPAQPEATGPQRTPHPRRTAGRKALPAVPQPGCKVPGLLQAAVDLLTDLRRHDSRLLLSATDTAHLVPGVAAWLERDVLPSGVRHALTTNLPDEPLHRPAALLAHRLADKLPPPAPFRPTATATTPPAPVRHPVRNCDGCDRGFRAPETETHCRDCREARRPNPPRSSAFGTREEITADR